MPSQNRHSHPLAKSPSRGSVSVLGMRSRLAILVIGLTGAGAWLACTYVIGSGARVALDQRAEHTRQIASLLALAVAPWLDSRSPITPGNTTASAPTPDEHGPLAAFVSDVTESSALTYAVIYDAAWNELAYAAALGRQSASRPTRDEADPLLVGQTRYRPASKHAEALLEVVHPITAVTTGATDSDGMARSRLLGYVRLGVSAKPSLDWAARTTNILAGVGIMVGLLAIPLCLLFMRRIATPLAHVSKTMEAFVSGDLSARCMVHHRDEIGSVADSFNRLAGRHEQTHDQLAQLNADLENQVARRTRKLRELATRDPLTGLYNRRHFDEALSLRFSEARRYGSELSCVMMDVDDFKSINDRLGHCVGDEVLVLLAQTIHQQLRSADVAARYGGDEVVILLPHTDDRQARVLCERISRAFSERCRKKRPGTDVTLSVGVSDLRGLDPTAGAELVESADQALYRAKRAGKRCIVTASAATSDVPSTA